MPHLVLSDLPRPTVPGLGTTLEQEIEARLDWLEETYSWRPAGAADPAYRVIAADAARLTLARAEWQSAMEQTTLAFATGANLDHIGRTYFATPRKPGEGDDVYRDRLAHVGNRYAVGLSGAWYEAVATDVEGVVAARMTSPNPGDVSIWVMADGAARDAQDALKWPRGIPDATLLAAVEAVVTAADTAQQTDTVTVAAISRQRYDAALTLTLAPGTPSAGILAGARAAVEAAAENAAVPGAGIDSVVLVAGAAGLAGVTQAMVVLSTVSEDAVPVVAVVPNGRIAASDSVAPELRDLTVTIA